VKDKIFIAEMAVLKTMNFQISFNLPYEFIFIYSAILYPENENDMLKYAFRIANDSFFTYANLLYKNYVVALSSIIISAKFLGIPCVFDKNFKNIDKMKAFSNPPCNEEEFNKKVLNFENKTFNLPDIQDSNNGSYFDILEFHKKLHPYLELNDLYECVDLILEFYEDMKNYAIKNT
jgi:hypothetical protein